MKTKKDTRTHKHMSIEIEEGTEYGCYDEVRTFLQIEFSYMYTPKEKQNDI